MSTVSKAFGFVEDTWTALGKKGRGKKGEKARGKSTKAFNEIKSKYEGRRNTIDRFLEELRVLSKTNFDLLAPKRDPPVNGIERFSEPKFEDYQAAWLALDGVSRQVTDARWKALLAKEKWAKLEQQAAKQLEVAEILTHEQRSGFYDRYLKCVQDAAGDDILSAYHDLTDLVHEIDLTVKSQDKSKKEFENLAPQFYKPKDESTPLGGLEKKAPRFVFEAQYQSYAAAMRQASEHRYQSAIKALTELLSPIERAREKVQTDSETWNNTIKDLSQKIIQFLTRKVDEEAVKMETLMKGGVSPTGMLPWTHNFKAEVVAATEYVVWRARSLGKYQESVDELQYIWNDLLGRGESGQGTIDKEIEERDRAREQDNQLMQRYEQECNAVQRLVMQANQRVQEDIPDWSGSLGWITQRLEKAVAITGATTSPLWGTSLAKEIENGRRILEVITTELQAFLDGDDAAIRNIQDIVAIDLAKQEYARLENAWTAVHDPAENRLDEVALFGGEKHRECLVVLESAEAEVSAARAKFLDYLKQFPDPAKVEAKRPTKEQAVNEFTHATASVGPEFMSKIESAMHASYEAIGQSRANFKRASDAVNEAMPGTRFFNKGTAGAHEYCRTLREKADALRQYGDVDGGGEPQSNSVGALNQAAEGLKKIAAELRSVAQDFSNDADTPGSFKHLDAKLKEVEVAFAKHADLKKFTPNAYEAIKKQFNEEIVPGVSGKGVAVAERRLDTFLNEIIIPATTGATKIRQIRENLPTRREPIDRLSTLYATTLNQLAGQLSVEPLATSPPDLGDLTVEYQGCINVILTEQSAGVVEAANERLGSIAERVQKLIDEFQSKNTQDKMRTVGQVVGQVQTRQQEVARRESEVLRVEQERKRFMDVEYKEIKDSDTKQTLQNLNKSVEQSLKRGAFLSAEESLRQMKRLYADEQNAAQPNRSKKLKPLGDNFDKVVAKVEADLELLRQEIERACEGDPAVSTTEVANILAAIPKTLTPRGIAPNVFPMALGDLDNAVDRRHRREFREKALQLVRDYKRIVMEDPFLGAVRKNPFVPVGSAALYGQLRLIEDAVIVTV